MNDTRAPAGIVGFQEEIAEIQTAIAEYQSGKNSNVAIISEPFAGRTTLVGEIEKMNLQKVTRISLSSVVRNKDELALPDISKRIVIIDDCQFLYSRKIGGFAVLEDFLEQVVSQEKMYITTWNIYSWRYLDEVMNISNFFPVQIKLHKFTADEIEECILSTYKEDEIKFVEDVPFEKEKLIHLVKYTVPVRPLKRKIGFPFIKINYHMLKFRLFKKEENIQDMIFDKIEHVSNGNPGVVKVVWEKYLDYPVIKPGKIKEFSFDIQLDYNEAFVLSIILSMKSIKKEELEEIVGSEFRMEEILFRLSEQGLVTAYDSYYAIRPEALRSIVEFLNKSRLVW